MTSVTRVRLSLADRPRPRRARLCEKNRYRPPVVRSCVQVRQSSLARSRVRRPLPFAAGLATGRNLRGPGLGPRLRFSPAGPCRSHALRQSCRTLRETPSSRASGNTASPALRRLSAASLKAVGKVLHVILSAIGHPLGCPVTEISVSHSRGAVQSSTVTVIT